MNVELKNSVANEIAEYNAMRNRIHKTRLTLNKEMRIIEKKLKELDEEYQNVKREI